MAISGKGQGRKAAAVFGLLLALSLAGCAGKDDSLPCPETGLILAASHLSVFSAAGGTDAENMVLDARLTDYRGACRYIGEEVEFLLEVDVAARRGPAGGTLKREKFPYFIAVLDPDENILQRQGFSTTVSFDNNGMGLTTEKHRLRLPLEDKKSVRLHKVVIGLEMTPEQLAYNRRMEASSTAPAAGKSR